MNRRKMFSELGLGTVATLFGVGKAKADSFPVANQDDIWVTHTCVHHVGIDGKYVIEPCEPIILNAHSYYTQTIQLEIGESNRKKKEKYDRNMALYNDFPKCGTVYRRIHGTVVACPKCGGYTDVERRDAGILVG